MFVELGYLRRAYRLDVEGAYYQVGIGHTCWMPQVECPMDRFDALGMKLKQRRAKKRGDDVLILGQVPEADQHGLPEETLAAW